MNPNAIRRAGIALIGKTYELTLTKDYVSKWGFAQAVRELIQNALDSESPFVYEFRAETGGIHATAEGGIGWTFILNSEFTTLTPQTLLLGATSKTGSAEAIGSFGEGYKLALLVLAREGFDVEVHNGDLIWRPGFKMSRTFGCDVLAIQEFVAPDRTNRGLTFVVRGLGDEEVAAVRDSCLRMQDSIGAIKSTQYGDILLERPGKLYVGSLYVCETGLRFGYNIKPGHIALERDRQTVDSFDLKMVTLKCWYETEEWDRIAEMIADEVPDLEYAEYNSPELIKEACYRVFRERHPKAIIASSPEEARKMVEEGLVNTVYVGGGMYTAVSRSSQYRSERIVREAVQAPPATVLALFLRDNRDKMQKHAIVNMKALIETARSRWTLK